MQLIIVITVPHPCPSPLASLNVDLASLAELNYSEDAKVAFSIELRLCLKGRRGYDLDVSGSWNLFIKAKTSREAA